MNPLFTWIIAETTARTKLEMRTRWCPKCGRKLVVPEEKLAAEVNCGHCGTRVPPKPRR
ncbi:MAG TPA: hypothetical protein VGV38_13625 [Pyrinomonadaceae bacterium]|nr:hypothetical protein [Pyrinomonadaceae bacterium]